MPFWSVPNYFFTSGFVARFVTVHQGIVVEGHLLQLGKGTAIYGLGAMLQGFISLLLLPLFTAYLSPEEYGVLAMLAILTMVAQPVFGLGMGAAMGPSYFEGNSETRKAQAVWTVFSILVVSSSVLLISAWFIPSLILKLVLLPEDYALLVSLTLTGAALSILSTPFMQRVQFEQQAKKFVVITLATTLTTIVLSVLTVVFLGWGVRGMVVSQLIGKAITFTMFIALALRDTQFNLDSGIRKEVLRLGIPFVPAFAFLFLLMHTNKYILQLLYGADEVGIYSVGFNIGSAISILVGAIQTAWFPFFMSFMEKQQEAKVLFGKIFTYYVFAVGLTSLCFFLFAHIFIITLVDQRYLDAVYVVGFASLVHFFIGAYIMFLPPIYFGREIPIQTAIQGATVVLYIPVAVSLIFAFGLLGAALSVALGHLLMAAFTYAWNIKRRNHYVNINYEWKRIGKFAGISLAIIMFSFWHSDSYAVEVSKMLLLFKMACGTAYSLLSVHERNFLRIRFKKVITASFG